MISFCWTWSYKFTLLKEVRNWPGFSGSHWTYVGNVFPLNCRRQHRVHCVGMCPWFHAYSCITHKGFLRSPDLCGTRKERMEDMDASVRRGPLWSREQLWDLGGFWYCWTTQMVCRVVLFAFLADGVFSCRNSTAPCPLFWEFGGATSGCLTGSSKNTAYQRDGWTPTREFVVVVMSRVCGCCQFSWSSGWCPFGGARDDLCVLVICCMSWIESHIATGWAAWCSLSSTTPADRFCIIQSGTISRFNDQLGWLKRDEYRHAMAYLDLLCKSSAW